MTPIQQELAGPIHPTKRSDFPFGLFFFLSRVKIPGYQEKAMFSLRPFDEKVFNMHRWLPLVQKRDKTSPASRTLKAAEFIAIQERLAAQQGFSYRLLKDKPNDPRWRQWYARMHEDWNQLSRDPDALNVLIPYGNSAVFDHHYKNWPWTHTAAKALKRNWIGFQGVEVGHRPGLSWCMSFLPALWHLSALKRPSLVVARMAEAPFWIPPASDELPEIIMKPHCVQELDSIELTGLDLSFVRKAWPPLPPFSCGGAPK